MIMKGLCLQGFEPKLNRITFIFSSNKSLKIKFEFILSFSYCNKTIIEINIFVATNVEIKINFC